MKTSTSLVSRIAALCGAVLLATTTFAHGSDAIETSTLTNGIESGADQVDPLQMTVVPFEYNYGMNIRCYGQSSGRATCTSTGGVSPYTYSWSHNASLTSNLASGLSVGSYTVTVTDAAGSTVTQSYTLVQPSAPLVSVVTASDILCNGGSSSVTIVATGGTEPHAPYTTSATVPVGTYTYQVSDANGCRSPTTITITEPDVLVASATPTAILCFGDLSDVTVEGTGGTLPYIGTGVESKLAGVYEFAISDANGCTDQISLGINQPGKLQTMASYTPIGCYGETSDVTITMFSGTEPYLGTGLYVEYAGVRVYHVSDLYGCPDSVIVDIDQPAMLNVTAAATTIDCHGGTATVDVSASGGVMPYSSEVGIYTLGSGNYSYSISDGNSCSETVSLSIVEPAPLSATASATAITCNGGTSDVTINATGGTGLYTGTGVISATAGTQTFSVTDENGCTTNVSATISEPTNPVTVSALAASSIQCAGETTSLNLSASGGTAPYTGTGTVPNVSTGTNTYSVVDANGCVATLDYTVAGPAPMTSGIINGVQLIDCMPMPVTFTANPTGGTAPYTYQWSNGETSSSITVNPNVSVAYDLTITDVNGCSFDAVNGAEVLVSNRCGNNNQKVVICHVPSGNGENPQTICISPNALDPHMIDAWNLHGGDYCGPCQSTSGLALDETNNGDNNFVRVGMNTSNETVEVSYRLAYDSEVSVEIYDMTGALVEVIHQGDAVEGQMYDVVVIPSKFTTGVYIYQFITNTERHIDKLQFIH